MNIKDIIDNEIKEKLKNDRHGHEKNIIVLSGGSIKGLAQAGALYCIEQYDMLEKIDTYSCTSAGSIIGMMIIAGYKPLEVLQFFNGLDTNKTSKVMALNFIQKFGLDDGERIMLVLKHILRAKKFNDNITFKDFYEKTKKKYIVTGSCLNTKKVVYFSYDTTPDIIIIDAIRASISIPLVFTPKKINNMLYIDGGCIDNYPIKIFDHCIENVIGILVSDMREKRDDFKNIEQYIGNVIQCLYEGQYIAISKGYEKQTVHITCNHIKGTQQEIFTTLFEEGFQTMKKNINRFLNKNIKENSYKENRKWTINQKNVGDHRNQ